MSLMSFFWCTLADEKYDARSTSFQLIGGDAITRLQKNHGALPIFIRGDFLVLKLL
jgi:hypothetical protein